MAEIPVISLPLLQGEGWGEVIYSTISFWLMVLPFTVILTT
jgi:hypothetical protein